MPPIRDDDDELPPSQRGQRASMSDSDVKELIDRQIGVHERRLGAFFDRRNFAEAKKVRIEAARVERDKEFRENLAKMGAQISDLSGRDAFEVGALHGEKEISCSTKKPSKSTAWCLR